MASNSFSPLHLERFYPGSATSLFDAWTFTPVAELWLFQSEKNEVDLLADVREGGEFHTVEKGQNHAVSHQGHYIKIDRPNELLFSLTVPSHFDGVSEIQVTIDEKPVGCLLKFTQKNVDTSDNVQPWKSMLEQIQKILESPYTITLASDKKELITAIHVVLMQLAGFVQSLPEEQINKVPFKNSWTAAQLLAHVLKSVAGMAAAIGKPGKPAHREPTKRVIELKQVFLDVTKKLPSPEIVVPEQKNYYKHELIKELQSRLKKLKEVTATADVSEIAEGLPFGEISKTEILHFLVYHSQRHLYQMNKIANAWMQEKI